MPNEKRLAKRLKSSQELRNTAPTEELQEVQQPWWQEKGLLLQTLSYLDTATLLQHQRVCTEWQELCLHVISSKCCETPKAFESKQELEEGIRKYCKIKGRSLPALQMEDMSRSYGYPPVSQICQVCFGG
jgi:hypothetical protein